MTMILTVGVDPGLTGALAFLADGMPVAVFDMPTRRVNGWGEVDAGELTAILRDMRGRHAGAYVSACVEKVQARPDRVGRREGATSTFRFGEGYGRICGVLEALGIPYCRAIPAVWKRRFGLLKQPKDASRLLALKRFPTAAKELQRKKDNGRADALLLALYAEHIDPSTRAA